MSEECKHGVKKINVCVDCVREKYGGESSFAASPGSPTRFTRQECLEALWELYRDYCQMAAERDPCERLRLPDYEAMLKQLEETGMPATENDQAQRPGSPDAEQT